MLRASALLLSVLALACSAPTRPVAQRTTAPAPPAPTFDPDAVRPAGVVGEVRDALERGDLDEARSRLREATPEASDDERAALAWLRARVDEEAGEPARAFLALGAVVEAGGPLAPWARLRRARIQRGSDPTAAARELRPGAMRGDDTEEATGEQATGEQATGERSPPAVDLTTLDWGGRSAAAELWVDAMRGAERLSEAEPLLRAMLAEAEDDDPAGAAALPLAELALLRGDDGRDEAVALLHRVVARGPGTPDGREAQERLDRLRAELPAARRGELDLPAADELRRADAFMSRMRFADAERAYRSLARQARDDRALRCRARFGEAKAVYRRRQRERGATLMEGVARDCPGDLDQLAWALFFAGRGYTMADRHADAIAVYDRLEREASSHSLADDARFRAALLLRAQGREDAFRRRLEELPTRYPDGDMRGKARFRLAWDARARGDREDALAQLEASLAEGPGEEREDLHGRAAYWRAVVLAESERVEDARAAFDAIVAERPLSYYAQQARVRLQELPAAASPPAPSGPRLTPTRAEAPPTEVEPVAPRTTSLRFPLRPEMETETFARALALLQVGEAEAGARELRHLIAQAERADDELRWIQAALLDRAGQYPRSVHLARRLLGDFMAEPPEGAHFARWRIAYPKAYATLIEEAAEAQSLPPSLVYAIAREESSFRSDAISVAHAYGLVQIIVPTARRFGRPLGLRATPRTLVEPETNLRIGTAFMAFLWNRYEDNPAILPAAYNAGQGATDRWLRERPRQRLDEWVEEIPYDETRRYTRRVLQTWGVYRWLDTGELPALEATLPRR